MRIARVGSAARRAREDARDRVTLLVATSAMSVLPVATVHGADVGRSVDEMLHVFAAFKMGALRPADWRPGQPTLAGG